MCRFMRMCAGLCVYVQVYAYMCRFMRMCARACYCVNVCVYVHIDVCASVADLSATRILAAMHVHISWVHSCVYVACFSVCVCVYVHVYVYIAVCVCICMCMFMCILMCVRRLRTCWPRASSLLTRPHPTKTGRCRVLLGLLGLLGCFCVFYSAVRDAHVFVSLLSHPQLASRAPADNHVYVSPLSHLTHPAGLPRACVWRGLSADARD